jgi:hypothetical protein
MSGPSAADRPRWFWWFLALLAHEQYVKIHQLGECSIVLTYDPSDPDGYGLGICRTHGATIGHMSTVMPEPVQAYCRAAVAGEHIGVGHLPMISPSSPTTACKCGKVLPGQPPRDLGSQSD